MLSLIPFDADNVVAIRVAGKIRMQEFEEARAAMENRFGRHETLHLYAEIDSFGGIALEALLKDIRFSLAHWQHFDREVIVTDKAWLHKVGFAANRVFPGVEIRVFPQEAREDARRFVVS